MDLVYDHIDRHGRLLGDRDVDEGISINFEGDK
jgi:hypothetical protein